MGPKKLPLFILIIILVTIVGAAVLPRISSAMQKIDWQGARLEWDSSIFYNPNRVPVTVPQPACNSSNKNARIYQVRNSLGTFFGTHNPALDFWHEYVCVRSTPRWAGLINKIFSIFNDIADWLRGSSSDSQLAYDLFDTMGGIQSGNIPEWLWSFREIEGQAWDSGMIGASGLPIPGKNPQMCEAYLDDGIRKLEKVNWIGEPFEWVRDASGTSPYYKADRTHNIVECYEDTEDIYAYQIDSWNSGSYGHVVYFWRNYVCRERSGIHKWLRTPTALVQAVRPAPFELLGMCDTTSPPPPPPEPGEEVSRDLCEARQGNWKKVDWEGGVFVWSLNTLYNDSFQTITPRYCGPGTVGELAHSVLIWQVPYANTPAYIWRESECQTRNGIYGWVGRPLTFRLAYNKLTPADETFVQNSCPDSDPNDPPIPDDLPPPGPGPGPGPGGDPLPGGVPPIPPGTLLPPFGGKITQKQACTCAAGGTASLITVGPPVGGNFLYIEGQSILFRENAVNVGNSVLGNYMKGVGQCMIQSGQACSPLPSDGFVYQIGTSGGGLGF